MNRKIKINMSTIKQTYYLDYYNSLVEGNKEKCSSVIQELIDEGTDIKDIYVDIFQKSLYAIGRQWDHSEISIPEEHLATRITEALINRFTPPAGNQKKYKSVVACIDKEYHELGAKMAANIFEMNGWKTYYLGASVPSREMLKYITSVDPDVIALSWSLYLNLGRFLELLDGLVKNFPHKKIIVGGQALNGNSDNILKKYPNVLYLQSIYQLDEFLKKEYQ